MCVCAGKNVSLGERERASHEPEGCYVEKEDLWACEALCAYSLGGKTVPEIGSKSLHGASDLR